MGAVAYNKESRAVVATGIDPEAWEALKSSYAIGDFTMHCCDSLAVPNTSINGISSSPITLTNAPWCLKRPGIPNQKNGSLSILPPWASRANAKRMGDRTAGAGSRTSTSHLRVAGS